LPNTLNNGNWIGIALIFFVFLLTRSKQMIRDSVSALFALKERKNLFASSTGYNIQNWLSVFLVAIVGFSLFVYDQAFNSLSEKIFISNFLLTALGVTVFFLFKYLSFAFFGNIFFDKATLRNWLKSYSTLFCVCGIVLILISALLLCNVNISAEILYIIGFIGIGITLILMLYKLIQIFFYKGYSIFYLLLYLCALEIMPVLVLVKALFVG